MPLARTEQVMGQEQKDSMATGINELRVRAYVVLTDLPHSRHGHVKGHVMVTDPGFACERLTSCGFVPFKRPLTLPISV